MSANTSTHDLDMECKRAINRAYYHRNKSVLFAKVKLTLTILAQTVANHCEDREEEDGTEHGKNWEGFEEIQASIYIWGAAWHSTR